MNGKKDIVDGEVVVAHLHALAPILLQLANINPTWSAIFTTFLALYPAYTTYRQQYTNDRFTEIADLIQLHPVEFRKQIIESEEFKNGFTVLLSDYLKSRSQRKREVIKRIMLGFSIADNKEAFELERMDSSLERMSIETLEFLIFFQDQIRPRIESDLLQKRQDTLIDFTDRSREWHHEMALVQVSVFEHISTWQEDRYSPMRTMTKVEYGLAPNDSEWPAESLARAESRYREEKRKTHESLLELDTLGILEKRATGGQLGAANSFFLTRFGIRFLKFFSEAQKTFRLS